MSIETELQDLYEATGRLTPAEVVEKAANPLSAMHPYFQWDDTAAAEAYRKIQAGKLIRSMKIKFQPSPTVEPIRMPLYYNAGQVGGEKEYKPITTLQNDPDDYAKALANARRELEQTRQRYENLNLLNLAVEVFSGRKPE